MAMHKLITLFGIILIVQMLHAIGHLIFALTYVYNHSSFKSNFNTFLLLIYFNIHFYQINQDNKITTE